MSEFGQQRLDRRRVGLRKQQRSQRRDQLRQRLALALHEIFVISGVEESAPWQMVPYLREQFGNPASRSHAYGWDAERAVEEARENVAALVNADPREIIFVRNTTEAINLVAQSWGRANLREGDLILVTEMEHHSNLVPWQRVAEKYPIGSRIKGKVRNFTSYGAFVEIEDGIDGLIHISDISWTERIRHPGDLYKKGEAIRRKLRGDAEYEKNMKAYAADPHTQKFIDLATETVFGALWTRPGLDLKTRALVCVVSDAVTGREPELPLHLRMALRQGWSEDEITEALIHLAAYVGLPLCREAMLVSRKVFAEMRKEAAPARAKPSGVLPCR